MRKNSYFDGSAWKAPANLGTRLSRRALLGKSVVLGLAATGVGLLSACGDDDTSEDPVDPGTGTDDVEAEGADDEAPEDIGDDAEEEDEATGEPQRGGSLRMATRGTADTFDPYLLVTVEEQFPVRHIYSGLTRPNVELEPQPDLAVSWDSNDAGDEWTFELQSSVTFHNGREFEAQDVVESFNRLLDPELGSQFVEQAGMIEEVTAVDSETALFQLSSPYGGFPDLLANYFAQIIPIEEADNLATAPVGTGPYVLESHAPGERTVIRRFEDYWDVDNQGFLDEIHFIHMPEESSRITALQGGDIDLIVDIAAPSVPLVEAAPDVHFEEVVTGTHITIIMTYDEEPWTDERVRTALKLCLNRDEILQAALQGYGETAADQPVPSADPMYPDLPIPEQDIDRATELLEEAGYPDGIDLLLHTSAGRAGMQETALAVQEMAAPAGFRIELQSHPIDQYWADIWMQVPFHISNWNARIPSDQQLQLTYVTGAAWNETDWENEEFDELVRQAQQATDLDERHDHMTQACTLLAEEGPVGIPIFRSGLDAWRDRVQGFEPHPMRWVDLHRVWIED